MASTYEITPDAKILDPTGQVYAALDDDTSTKLARDETCALLATVPDVLPKCRVARTCRSCLRKTGCMVDVLGRCSDPLEIEYPLRRHYRSTDSSTSLTSATQQQWYFPSSVATYCAASDAACHTCHANAAFTAGNDSRYCVGRDGCVCIANCLDETILPAGKMLLICSNQLDGAALGKKRGEHMSAIVQILAMAAGTLALLACLLNYRFVRLQRYRRDWEAEQQRLREAAQQALRERRNKSAQLGVGELHLDGWKVHREASREMDETQNTLRAAHYVAIHDVVVEHEEETGRATQ